MAEIAILRQFILCLESEFYCHKEFGVIQIPAGGNESGRRLLTLLAL